MMRLISAPYHLGRYSVGMGGGPDRILAAGAASVLGSKGHRVVVERVERPVPFGHETGAHFALLGALAERVQQASTVGDFAFVLGGNCSCVLGAIAGLGLGKRSGVVWFDAHGDANTPETTTSGFLDGMPVAILTGRCWSALASSSIPGFVPLPDDRIVLGGVRALDDGERALIHSSGIALVEPDRMAGEESDFVTPLDRLAGTVESVQVHIDLDVIDLSDGRANEFAAAGGPPLSVLDAAIRTIAD